MRHAPFPELLLRTRERGGRCGECFSPESCDMIAKCFEVCRKLFQDMKCIEQWVSSAAVTVGRIIENKVSLYAVFTLYIRHLTSSCELVIFMET